MKAVVINPFLTSTIDLFARMFSLEAVPGTPHLVDGFGNHRWEVSGVISFVGEHLGLVVIRLPKYVGMKLLDRSGILADGDAKPEALLPEMVGEFTNIIAGNASGPLQELGFDLKISPPVVIQGKNHTIHWPLQSPIIGLPFNTEVGPFTVDISMKNIKIL